MSLREVKETVWVVRGTYQFTKETTKLVYRNGKFTVEVVRAPLEYPLVRDDVQTIDGLPVKEAIRLGRVKNAPQDWGHVLFCACHYAK